MIGDARVSISYKEWQAAELAKRSTEEENSFASHPDDNQIQHQSVQVSQENEGSLAVEIPSDTSGDRLNYFRGNNKYYNKNKYFYFKYITLNNYK